MTPQGEKSYLKTTKKGNVTINPRKEDLMSESLRRIIQSNLSDLREAAKKKDKEKKVKRWWDDDGDGIGYEKGEVKKEEAEVAESNCGSDHSEGDSEKKNSIKDRMKQKMMQATAEKDKQRSGLMPSQPIQGKSFCWRNIMPAILLVIKPILFKLIGSCQVKKLVVELLDRYVKTTDNDVDDLLASTVKTALLKGCE